MPVQLILTVVSSDIVSVTEPLSVRVALEVALHRGSRCTLGAASVDPLWLLTARLSSEIGPGATPASGGEVY